MRRPQKTCAICESGVRVVDFKDERTLSRFLTERGKILPSRLSGTCARHQRQLSTAIKRARQLAHGPTVAYRYMKENLNRAVHGELGECLDMEAAHHIRTGQTDDHKEAAKAFVDKRPPAFRGR